MTIDITLQVMANPSTHALPPEKEAGRYKRGDIVAVYKRSEITGVPAPSARSVFIHITGVPVAIIQKAKKLMREEMDNTNPDKPEMIKRRQFNIDPQSLPSGIKAQLQANRYVTVTWAQAKPYLIDMKTGLQVQDGDLD